MAESVSNAVNTVVPEAGGSIRKYEDIPEEQVFTFCWQSGPRIDVRYLIYRWVQFALHFTFAAMSLCEIGRTMHSDYFAAVNVERSVKYYLKWFLYLTHWGLLLNAAQSFMGAWMVHQAYVSQTLASTDNNSTATLSSKFPLSLYHRLFAVSLNLSAYISIGFWMMVFDPSDSVIDPVTVSEHGIGTVLLVVDLLVANISYKLVDVIFTMLVSFVYLSFTYVHHVCQGLDRYQDKQYLYEKCDWNQTIAVLAHYAITILALMSFHFILWSVYLLKRRITMKWARTNPTETSASSIPIAETSTPDLKRGQPPND